MSHKGVSGIRTSVYIDKAVFNALNVYAARNKISKSKIISALLENKLSDEGYL